MQKIGTFSTGATFYYYNDDLHREDGPAVTLSDGALGWYLNGFGYIYETYLEELSKTKSAKEILVLRLKYD